MLIRVINPNTTRSMTDTIGHAARAVAAPGTEIDAVTSPTGPVSIEGYYDEALCLPGLLIEIHRGEELGASAHVIACFDDTGLDAARQAARAPVIGIGEAAYHAATLIAHKFTVITTLARSISPLEHNLAKYGFERRGRVRAVEIPVLDLEGSDIARTKIGTEIERAKAEDRAEAIVLGCAGMADLARQLSEDHGCPVIDGVSAAVKLAEMLAGLGLATSKVGAYQSGPPKTLTGPIARLFEARGD